MYMAGPCLTALFAYFAEQKKLIVNLLYGYVFASAAAIADNLYVYGFAFAFKTTAFAFSASFKIIVCSVTFTTTFV